MKRIIQSLLLLCSFWVAQVIAAEPIERVVAAGGDITEIIYALGQQHRLVAVDTTSTYPADTATLAKVGYLRALPAEGIASMQPQLVIASDSAGPPAVWRQLQGLGITLAKVSSEASLLAVETKITQVANALGVQQRGDGLAREFRSAIERAGIGLHSDSNPPSTTAPKVMFILGHGGGTPMVAGEQTSADVMIRLAGGRNVFAGLSGYKPMTAEAVVQANPDIILLTSQGRQKLGGNDSGGDGVLELPGIGLTNAGRNADVLDYDALLLLGFGLRTPEIVQRMRADFQRVTRQVTTL